MKVRKLAALPLAALLFSFLSSTVFCQTTDNKDVIKKEKAKPAAPQNQTPEKPHRLKGAFKGQAIDSPQGQSLSDVVSAAHAAQDQKDQDKEKGKPKPVVINNQDLKAKETPAVPAGKRAPAPETPAPATAVTPYNPTDSEGHDEAYWRDKASATRDRATRAKTGLEEAETEAKKQENDFYSWDDGQYRDNVIKPAWDRAKEAVTKAQKELEDAQQALKNLEDDARRAGALPGWIR